MATLSLPAGPRVGSAWYARGLIDSDKARQLLTEAIAIYGQIGMPKHVEMAEAMLSEV